jgi:CRP/FNR family cyclic AMP-dependent transcriptional regulator
MTTSTWPASTLLGRLDAAARKQLLSLGVRRSTEAGQDILREGLVETHVILLDEALVKVTAAMADGRKALLAIRVPGDVVGEISALNCTPRSATVTTCRPGIIRVIHRQQFIGFLRGNPEVAMKVAGIVADRLRWANRRRVDFASYPVRVRLARVLWEIAAAYGRRESRGVVVNIDITQAELATMCGAAEVTLQKSLRQMRDASVIDTGYRQIVVLDPDALRRYAEWDESLAARLDQVSRPGWSRNPAGPVVP